jgi:hypothetical protein
MTVPRVSTCPYHVRLYDKPRSQRPLATSCSPSFWRSWSSVSSTILGCSSHTYRCHSGILGCGIGYEYWCGYFRLRGSSADVAQSAKACRGSSSALPQWRCRSPRRTGRGHGQLISRRYRATPVLWRQGAVGGPPIETSNAWRATSPRSLLSPPDRLTTPGLANRRRPTSAATRRTASTLRTRDMPPHRPRRSRQTGSAVSFASRDRRPYSAIVAGSKCISPSAPAAEPSVQQRGIPNMEVLSLLSALEFVAVCTCGCRRTSSRRMRTPFMH